MEILTMATTSKNVQIPTMLFWELVRYFIILDEIEDDSFIEHRELLKSKIKVSLNDKLDKMAKRELYSKQFDKELTNEERELARKEYLDMVGIHKDFRY